MASNLSDKRVAVLGAGKLGGMLLQALVREGMLSTELTRATVRHSERALRLTEKLGVDVGTDNSKAVQAPILFFFA